MADLLVGVGGDGVQDADEPLRQGLHRCAVEQVEGVVDAAGQTGRTGTTARTAAHACTDTRTGAGIGGGVGVAVGVEGFAQAEEQVEFGCWFAGGQGFGVDA
ncbi:hypothetical protein ACPYPG_35485, partial [Streptomyces sp. FR-108]|uniref:hypothetical protein n=1 Tax=Streptomyces sp. FR-108 TaxID=3416665 RepID=UPI003CF42490